MKIKIKICGMTRAQDIQTAVTCQVDAIGLVFVSRSPRFIGLEKAARLAADIPSGTECVGLFMDDSETWIRQVCSQVPVTCLQFHGSENNAFCQSFGLPWIKTIAMANSETVKIKYTSWPQACALLLDGHAHGEQGGQGKAFDWNLQPETEQKIILAGGLNANNVATAISQFQPWAVDVSSGLESAPGIKDAQLIKRFCNEVRKFD
jgi:phosphoribosylanthranilate isomerase